MKIALVCGSHRAQSQSAKVARYCANYLQTKDVETYVLDLSEAKLPFWDEERWTDRADQWNSSWTAASREISQCDGLVIVSPEWSGMVPAALKNFFLLCDRGELAHKPALIVSVSSSQGGSYPVAELRMSSYKNTNICYIPNHVIVRDAIAVLSDSTPVSKSDEMIRSRLQNSLDILKLYTHALMTIRHEGIIKNPLYPFGM